MLIPSKKEIEADYLKKFVTLMSSESGAKKAHWKRYDFTNDTYSDVKTLYNEPVNPMHVFDFISSTRSHDLSAIIEWVKLEKMENTKDESDSDYFFGYGYNRAIDDFIAHLTSLQENV